ncbi:MAG: PEGA domain-containing protein [Candidatus Aenigmarchaeota archaeon]|nr:PEGA domain-containing protein [Candidatus Aenigmarchaeota archaeon]
MKKKVLLLALLAFIVLLILPKIVTAVCDLSSQTYSYKSAFFYVRNAKRIRVTVYNSMGDIYSRCFTAWIKIDGKYINLDGLPYSPENWQQAWASTIPSCYTSGYRIASGSSGYAEYDLERYAPDGYTGEVEVRVSSYCYETERADPCFCWEAKVEVLEYYQPTQHCYLDIYVKDQNKNPLSAYIYIDGSYLAYTSHILEKVLVGTHTISASKPGYTRIDKTVSCSCSETKNVEIVLTPVQVCKPGEIRNRYCACSTQVAYEKCKSDGSEWEKIVENCPSGYICEDGYCVLDKDGWYDTGRVRCNLSGLECGYGTKEKEQEYRDYTCSGSTCTYIVKQKRWVSIGSCYQGCASGYVCEAGYCVRISCEEGYVEEYRCYGNWVQKKYVYSDCSSSWINWGYCSYGCSKGTCLPKTKEPCKISLTVTTPENIFVNESVRTTVRITNSGDEGCYVNLDVYVCSIDKCYLMGCNEFLSDPKVYVQAQGIYVLSCTTKIKEEGSYKVKVSYSWLGRNETIYSGTFLVKKEDKPKCTARFLDAFKCEGKWKLQLYQYSDCSVSWGYVKYCEYGCERGECLAKQEVKLTEKSEDETSSRAKKEKNLSIFDVTSLSEVFLLILSFVVLLLIILLFVLVLIKKGTTSNKPEEFRDDC